MWKYLLLGSALLLSGRTMGQDLTEGLVGYYSFCGCTANDYSGNNNHGTLVGEPQCIEGIKGEGFYFNPDGGSTGCSEFNTDFIRLPTFGAIWEDGFSVCAWVEYENIANFERIIDFGNGSGDGGGMNVWFGREGNSDNLTLESWINSDGNLNRSVGRLVAEDAITNGQIEFYVATIEGSIMKIYVNGSLVAQKQGHQIANVSRSQNFIGRSNWCQSDPDFQGFIDEVRIYKRALSAEEILQMYDSPFITTSANNGVCLGESLQLHAQGGHTYEWSPGATLSATDIPNPIASPSAATTYTCRITFPDGCFLTDTIRVEVHEDQEVTIQQVICEGEIYEGYSEPGVYVDQFTSQYGCDSTRTLELGIIPVPMKTEVRHICRGESYDGYTESGVYQDFLPAANSCDTLRTLELTVGGPELTKLEVAPTSCGRNDGAINFLVAGGSGPVMVRLNGITQQSVSSIEQLASGVYELVIVDEFNCSVDTTLLLAQAPCPIYVPNVFSPNLDGINDQFRIYSWSGFAATVRTYQIFDRWGALLYETGGFSIHSTGQWWDGRVAGEPAEAGVYVYYIEVETEDGRLEALSGDVTIPQD